MDLDAVLLERRRRQQLAVGRERELNIIRSGSAPPSVEGSLAAVGSLIGGATGGPEGTGVGGEDIRTHPAYLSYYYSNENLNPRLPPPAVSREDWRVISQRIRTDGNRNSLFTSQPGAFDGVEARRSLSRQASSEWLDRGSDGLIGWSGGGANARRKSFTDVLQEGLGQSALVHLSRPASRNAMDDVIDRLSVPDEQSSHLLTGLEPVEGLRSGATTPGLARDHNIGSPVPQSFASVVGSSLSRSTTPDPQMVGRSPSPHLHSVGGMGSDTTRKPISAPNKLNGVSSYMPDHADVATALSGLNLSKSMVVDGRNHVQNQLFQELADQSNMSSLAYNAFSTTNGVLPDLSLSNIPSDGQTNLPREMSSVNQYGKVIAGGSTSSENVYYHGTNLSSLDITGSDVSRYPISRKHLAVTNSQLDSGNAGQYPNTILDQLGTGVNMPIMDQLYLLQRADFASQAESLSDPSGRNYVSPSQMDLHGFQKTAYFEALLAQQKSQYGMPYLGKSGHLDNGYYRSSFGLGVPYPASPMANSFLPSMGSRSPLRQTEHLSRFPSMMRSPTGGSIGSWASENGLAADSYASSFLDDFKNNKSKSFELSEIADHIAEFSVDQYGSRFIQQKLETALEEEKNMVFPEILSHSQTLMIDVFGNYVIQKFFEHGSESQRKQLANQLCGRVLSLSLQMYGCRVIQKALEVVDVEQQTQMVLELDGSVMKCVRDQNGNHVIQKCIECVPQERIQFIITAFYGQVVQLSMHPYGCRVIQRVLEHCDDPQTQCTMMEEIMQSVCSLAQDQYGNYVVQHVLQHGKPHERSAIICKLAGQIVPMSQQKYASNVVEKCLTYGTPEERQLLINEMLGSTDENEPLQAMMKDQFANYVVQKVLETCDDQNRELILSRIKVHLNALKRYTYGKHIVARVEKLVIAGGEMLA
ncbi:hypothetical protein QJS04_geneDACA002112 [Acorus gramineus]|uniref:PUM-HD domain-containing protein n=1 Tax=Acorus gramineus TaxID=55184 RepID=A0AAV9A7P7_ACOGR|nr:hypothetical protein QJS04_geneDACA002112 [Acorus gramineus]